MAASAEAGTFLALVRAAFALSNILNWHGVTSGLNNEDDAWNRVVEESERQRRGVCQMLDTSCSLSSFECFSSYVYAYFSEVMDRERRILQSEHNIRRVLARLSSTSAPKGRRERATAS
jgi:hypothetical protein